MLVSADDCRAGVENGFDEIRILLVPTAVIGRKGKTPAPEIA